MTRRHEPAAASDERLRVELLRQMYELHTRPHVQCLRPAAEQSVLHPVGDAVDFAMRAACGLLRHEAVIARATRLVHVEERDEVAFAERVALHIRQRAANVRDDTDGYVAR